MDVEISVSGMRVASDRLLLRPLGMEDLQDFYAWCSVPGVGEMVGWPHHQSREQSRQILESLTAGDNVLALWHKADERMIGTIGFHPSWAADDERFRHLPSLQFGYALDRDYWGRSLMPEAVRAAMDWAAENYPVRLFTCNHFTDNARSRRVIEKCGFTYDSTVVFYAAGLGRNCETMRYIKRLA